MYWGGVPLSILRLQVLLDDASLCFLADVERSAIRANVPICFLEEDWLPGLDSN